ncbi:hypothetical protein EDF68_102502 [Ochrobactrum sp. BH3]|nr:hypothetical protein EDF68_102502 [Ochrobactrum sp. BH3]
MQATLNKRPHDRSERPTIEGLAFDLARAARSDQPAYDLGNSLCNLETAIKHHPSITAIEHERLAMAFAAAAAASLRRPTSIRYADDISLGISATLRLLGRWRAGANEPFADGVRSDMRIFRNALHNADLRSQRQEREALDPQHKMLRIVGEILAPIQHLLVQPTDAKIALFRSLRATKATNPSSQG